MTQNRRRFLAASAGAAAVGPAVAMAAPPRPAAGTPQAMPRGLSFCTLRGAEGVPTLGLRTARGAGGSDAHHEPDDHPQRAE